MYKNIAIVLLACCCIFLVVNQRMERSDWENRSVGAPVYGGLIALFFFVVTATRKGMHTSFLKIPGLFPKNEILGTKKSTKLN